MSAKKIPDKSNFLEKFAAVESYLKGKVQMPVSTGYAPNTVIKNDPDPQPSSAIGALDMKCPSCGYPQPHDSVFCGICGYKFISQADVQVVKPEVAQVPIVEVPKTYKCSTCGAPHNPDDVFCEECGNKL